MLFGISYSELLLLIGAGIYLVGPKELPRVAKGAGRVTGKAVSYIAALRSKALSFGEATEITKLHAELQSSMQQLQAIRSELRSGVDIFNPGPLTRRLQSQRQARPSSQSEGIGSRLPRTAVLLPEMQRNVNRGVAGQLVSDTKQTSSSRPPAENEDQLGERGVTSNHLMDCLLQEDLTYSADTQPRSDK